MNHPVVIKFFSFIDDFIYALTNELIIAYGAVFVAFIAFIILAVSLNSNKTTSIIFLSIAFAIITTGPIVAYEYVEKTYRTTEYKQLEIKQLMFKNSIMIKGYIVNRSKKLLKKCKVKAKIYNKTDSEFKKFISLIKPKSHGEYIIKNDIYPNKIGYFKIIANRIKYTDNVDVSLKIRCK
jgi:hypothetical protein